MRFQSFPIIKPKLKNVKSFLFRDYDINSGTRKHSLVSYIFSSSLKYAVILPNTH